MGVSGLSNELRETAGLASPERLSRRFGRGAFVVSGLLVAALLFVNGAQAAHVHKEEAGRFLTNLIAEADANLSEDTHDAVRQAWLAKLVFSGFDVDAVSQYVMGPHWLKATAREREEFRSIFAEYLLLSFGNHLQSIPELKIEIKAARHLGENATVVRSNLLYGMKGATLYIDWRLRKVDQEWRIADIVVQGISFVSVLRSEFVAVLDQSGGAVESLLAELRRKNAKFYAAAE